MFLNSPEMLLKTNCDYYFSLGNATASDSVVDINLIWYEITTDAYQKLIPSALSINLDSTNAIDTSWNSIFNVAQNSYYGYKFDGAGDLIQITRSTSIEPTSQITIEFRVKLGVIASAQNNSCRIVAKLGGAGGFDFLINSLASSLSLRLFIGGGIRTF